MKTNEITTIEDLHNLEMRLIKKIESMFAILKSKPSSEYLRSSEVQKLLGNISESKLSSLRKNRAISFTFLAGTYLYPKAEIDAMLQMNLLLAKPKVLQEFGNSEISDLKTSSNLKNGQ